jgi:hypothetical protein
MKIHNKEKGDVFTEKEEREMSPQRFPTSRPYSFSLKQTLNQVHKRYCELGIGGSHL